MKQMLKKYGYFLPLISMILLSRLVSIADAFTYHWELDETPQGAEMATIVEPIVVTLLDEPIEVPSHSASLALMRKYSVYLQGDWSPGLAYRLLQTFESIPQETNHLSDSTPRVEPSVWRLSRRHVPHDIEIQFEDGNMIVRIAQESFGYATPRLAEIEGVRGRFFSKRLHRAIVRFLTDEGADRYALERILQERYAVSVNIPDYSELTRQTTGEHAGRFDIFKNEELLSLVSMLEEFPQGMLTTPGLKYFVRRLDGTPHPTDPQAAAVAWTGAGYIEFMESAFKGQGADNIHRLILHEKAHFFWAHLFDEQLKIDWIQLGGWFKNPDDKDGWSTTKQVEFVSAYAHGNNPDEDMAESISYYIINPDKLRSRSPAKYEFIQNRIMHGTRYISKIREDLTFEVCNLYPDYVYPGRIIRVDIQVEGEPEEDKLITVEIELHKESDLDAAQTAYIVVFSEKGTYFDIWLSAVDANGMSVASGHILRGQATVSRYAANGYWHTDSIMILDAQHNERFSGPKDFGWQLYIDNPLADDEAPIYVKNSLRLSLSEAKTDAGRAYQILTARWRLLDKNDIKGVYAVINDASTETYSRQAEGKYDPQTQSATAEVHISDYSPSGPYKVNRIFMVDVALNMSMVDFTDSENDEPPATIEVQTTNPDTLLPVLDVNRITVEASPTHPEAPNGETRVDIIFRVKDNISGYAMTNMHLRNPQGTTFFFRHYDKDFWDVYFSRDPTVDQTYYKTTILPAGSAPGLWGLAEMTVFDKAGNTLRADFTEIVRFEVGDGAAAPTLTVSLPQKTELLTNYPNPFNPETWIPYQLAASADVTLTIYAADGAVVRTLAVGHQPAGTYQSRARAAYWNGRNAVGELVASGVYFYTLTAGDFRATRKLLIRK